MKLDSWDGEDAYVRVDGADIWSANPWYYEGSEACGRNRGWDGSYDDQHYIDEKPAHAASTLDLVAGSTLDQSADDESVGIDDVEIWIR